MRSMTGYGKTNFASQGSFYFLEVHAVNRKNLDMSIFLPREMLSLDVEVRKWIAEQVKRGQVTLKLTKEIQTDLLEGVMPDSRVMRSLKKSWELLANELGYSKDVISLPFLVNQLDNLPKSHKNHLEQFSKEFYEAFQEAISSFIKMRQTEGFALAREMHKSLSKIKEELSSIGNYMQEVSKEYRAKLEAKLKEFDLSTVEMQEKIAREVVLYVDKGDITEEIGRLDAHIKSFEENMGREDAVGKTLDFIVLEMNREANTMAAKSQHLEATKSALSIKSEIEKIREQIQNIE